MSAALGRRRPPRPLVVVERRGRALTADEVEAWLDALATALLATAVDRPGGDSSTPEGPPGALRRA
jgi:hypothetical protein